MNQETREPPLWLGPAVVLCGLAGVLLAGSLWPVLDDRPLKMSCYWAMRAVVPLSSLLGLCGVALTAAKSRQAARPLAWLAIAAGLMQVLTIHVIIPVMPHNVIHQRVHDLIALAACAAAAAGLAAMRPGIDIDEALDAAAAAAEQPEA